MLVLELVRPDPKMGVHSYDILTMMTDDGAKVLSCLLWGDCTTSSSHSCTSGYAIDVPTETIYRGAKWYSACFAQFDAKRVGTKIPGLQKACLQACEAHDLAYSKLEADGHSFLKMVRNVVVIEPQCDYAYNWLTGRLGCHDHQDKRDCFLRRSVQFLISSC